MKQRLIGIAALLAIGALMAGVPWLLTLAITRVRIRFDLTTPGGWLQAISTPDDGTLLIWVLITLGAIAWAVLVIAIIVELTSLLRHIAVPRLRGLGVPQAIAHALVAAAMGAVLTSNLVSVQALAAPGPAPVDTGGLPSYTPIAPEARPDRNDRQKGQGVYVVKKGDTLWDIADDKLDDPYAYPEIFKASKHTVQPDGRHLVDPDLIYPGWKITIPNDDPPDEPAKPRQSEEPSTGNETTQPTAGVTTAPATAPSTSATSMPASAGQSMPATPTAAVPESGHASRDANDVDDVDPLDESAPVPWMLAGLGGAGALLAGGLWLWLGRRRAAQFRFRRPGRTIIVPEDPDLAAVEKTLRHQGDLTSDLVDRIAQTTQRLAARLHQTGHAIPNLVGIDVTYEYLTFRFVDPADLPEPWEHGDDHREWRIRTDIDADLIGPWDEENEPVWPTLVTLGQDGHGWRMVNLETLGVITLTGNQQNAEDIVRYWIAELSVAHWARDVEIAGGDMFGGLAPLIRHRFWEHKPDDVIGGLVETATTHKHWLAADKLKGMDAARAAQAGPELWRPRILVTASDQARLDELVDLVTSHPGCTGDTVIRLNAGDGPHVGTEIRLTDSGRVQVPDLGLDLVANGITADEASGCAALMDTAENPLTDAPMPDTAEPAAEWQRHCDAAGHLHADMVIPRGTTLAALSATSVLPEPDLAYITETANTVEDLAEIAPLVPDRTTTAVNEADPNLDQDLADWRADSIDRPRISVLGPVRLRLGRGGQPTVGIKRVAYYTEIVAYLATRPHGATADELVTALGITAERVRVDLHTLRGRLGINPATGRYFVPNASDNPEAHLRNEGIYLIEDLLCDANLFRRLRVRGEAAAAAGIDDLANALRLVTGKPYEQLRRRGGLWLAETRDDQHLLVGVVDVAHLLTTHALATGDLRRARAAAELARAVAPGEVTPQLDLAVMAEHEGSPDTADRIAREVTDWLDGTGEGPLDIGQRADTILRAHRRLEPKGRVS